MISTTESAPSADQPPIYDERQLLPYHLIDIELGYLANLGSEVELVHTTTDKVFPVTIETVGRSFPGGDTPKGDRRVTPAEIDEIWMECDLVTFFRRLDAGEAVFYDYDHLSYAQLGLGPQRIGAQEIWPSQIPFYLRWPIREDEY